MKLNKALLLGVLALIVLAGSVFGQGSVEGTVKGANGKGVANVTVKVSDGNAKTVATAKTDDEGAFSIEGIAAGTYSVSVAVKGFKPASESDVTVEDDDIAAVDFTLEPVAATPKPPTPKRAVTDFSGTWTLNRTTSKLNDQFNMAPTGMKVVQAGNDLDVERYVSMQGKDVSVKDKFTLDGKECINPGWADTQKRSTAVWSKDKTSLIITTKTPMGDNGDMTVVEIYRLKDKHLVIEARSSSVFGEVAETLVFDKK